MLSSRARTDILFQTFGKDFPTLEFEPRDQFEQRQKKLEQIRALGIDPFPREFRWTETPATIIEKYSSATAPELEADKREVRVAGRLVSFRLMGKAGFAHLQGSGKRVQVYARKDVLGEKDLSFFICSIWAIPSEFAGICFERRQVNCRFGSKK